MIDKIRFEASGITIEIPPEPAGPVELAKLMVSLRHVSPIGKFHLSDEAVITLIKLAFYLSMRSDEGRFSRLRIISGKRDDYRLSVKFTTPIKFDNVHELRRLAPVAESPDFALLVTESQDDGLECPGLANIGHLGLQSKLGHPAIIEVGMEQSLRIWIEGPGHLYIEETTTSFEFRAGRIRPVFPAIVLVPKLRDLIVKVGIALHQRALETVKGISRADIYFGGHSGLSDIIKVMLRRILDTCFELRHGGALVILPGGVSKPEVFDISCKYPLESPNLGDDIANYWSTHIHVAHSRKEGLDEYDRWLSKSYHSKARLLTNVDAVAHMSAADGCVVLTEHLNLLGFGGKILVSEAESKNEQKKVKLSNDHSCDIDDFLNNVGGQRHQSAARLVIKHNEVIVLVISQDGELSVFASDSEGYVRVYRPVYPYFRPKSN